VEFGIPDNKFVDMEAYYQENNTPMPAQRAVIAAKLQINLTKIKIWFCNRYNSR